uniref:Peptidase A1 domain-containing protein n=1 Tax=Maylandia zebra TaxID=106582 RepID=A0A3P9CV63_9CICH
HKCLVVVLVWVVLAEGTVLFDTSSANLWVDLVCCNTQACKTGRKFDPQQSSTATAKCLYFYLPYETRSLSGVFRCDTVNVGQTQTTILYFNSTNIFFLTAFSDYPNLSISAGRRTPLMDNMITQNLLSSKIFCFFLSRYNFDNINICAISRLSYITLHCYFSIICWTPATSETYWQIGVQGFLINTGWCSQSCQASLETSNPKPGVNYIMQKLEQTNTLSSECNNLPTLRFFISAQNQNGCQYCSVSMTPTYQPSPNGQPLRTFGDVLLRDRVGFAIVV